MSEQVYHTLVFALLVMNLFVMWYTHRYLVHIERGLMDLFKIVEGIIDGLKKERKL